MSLYICSDRGRDISFPSTSTNRTSLLNVWYISPVITSPTRSSYLLIITSFSKSLTLCISVCFAKITALLPKSSILISSATSSPISKSSSIFLASDRVILSKSQISSELSSTISLNLIISRSPLSALITISKFSSNSNFFFIIALKTSCNILIIVGLSTFFCLANSVKVCISTLVSIIFFKKNGDKCPRFHLN